MYINRYVAIFVLNKKNLLNNLQIVRSKIHCNAKICVMIKADAYSHGIVQVATILCNIVDYFGVANVLEGVKVRKCGVKTPILCVGYFSKEDAFIAKQYNIELCIYNFECFDVLKSLKGPFSCHIKINTGMTRLGFEVCEIKKLKQALKIAKNIKINGIFSHFQDSLNNTENTEKQFKKFIKVCSFLDERHNLIWHISNSDGVLNSKYNLDMVRVGMIIYGYGVIKGLKPVLQIKSEVIDIHKIKKGDSVGYDLYYKAKQDVEYIATIPFGYADGLDRRYSNCYIWINDCKYKIIGKICMDMCMVLVDENVKIGDTVIILKDAVTFAHFSKKSIYEVISNFKNLRSEIIIN